LFASAVIASAEFLRVVGIDVERDEPCFGIQRVRARGEVGETRSDREDEISFGRDCIRGGAAADANWAELQRMIPGQAALAGLRFRERNRVALGEGAQCFRGVAVKHAAAGDDDRTPRCAQRVRGVRDLRGGRYRRGC